MTAGMLARMKRRRIMFAALVTCAVLWLCGIGRPALGLELDARQKQLLADAQSHQARFEANMKLALDSAGPGEATPPGSKARLAKARLEAAMQSVPTLEARFGELPADDDLVKQLRARFDATLADGKKLEARLSGQSAAANPGAPAAAGVKLDYRQEELLKGAKFNLDTVDGYANGIDGLIANINQAADRKSVDFREVLKGMQTVAEARRKLGFAGASIAQLPADGRGVAEAAAQQKALAARIDAADKFLAPLNTQLQAAIDVNNYPDFNDDRKRLNELTIMFDPALIESQKPAAVETINQADAARQERNRIVAKYADLIQQDTDAGRQIKGSAEYFDSKYASFAEAVGKWKQTAPTEIDASIKDVNEMVASAVAEEKPAFFNGGVPQRMSFVEERVNLYVAIDPQAAKPYVDKLAGLRSAVKQEQAKLSEGIIAANEVPPDRYRGDDRAAIEAAAIAEWKAVQPDAQILRICIASQEWNRESMWRLQNTTWYKIDRSKLQVQLLVAHDGRLAVIRPVNVWIDHISNDKRTATNLDDIKDELPPDRFVLLAKVKG